MRTKLLSQEGYKVCHNQGNLSLAIAYHTIPSKP